MRGFARRIPRGHFSRQYRFPNCVCPRPHLRIGCQRHRCDLAWLMAGHTTPLNNWPKIRGERDLCVKGAPTEQDQGDEMRSLKELDHDSTQSTDLQADNSPFMPMGVSSLLRIYADTIFEFLR